MTKDVPENTAMMGDNFTDHFLIAMPSLNDGFFNQAVTYICEHDENGSFGLVINQATNIQLHQVLNEMNIDEQDLNNKTQEIFIGGPVDQGRGFVLHRPTGNWSSSLLLKNDVALTTSKDIMRAMACNKGPDDSLITLGYAGWAAGQLEQEMANNTWLSCPADEQIIFNTPVEQRWKAAAKLIGIDMSLLSNETGHA